MFDFKEFWSSNSQILTVVIPLVVIIFSVIIQQILKKGKNNCPYRTSTEKRIDYDDNGRIKSYLYKHYEENGNLKRLKDEK